MITNTSNAPKIERLFGGNPNAIEAQEAQGQQELVKSSQLPVKANSPRGVNAAEKYRELGICVVGNSAGDNLFLNVTLPDGWQIQATGHPMWSKLIDANGKEIASIFYKAAFYDREAFINFGN